MGHGDSSFLIPEQAVYEIGLDILGTGRSFFMTKTGVMLGGGSAEVSRGHGDADMTGACWQTSARRKDTGMLPKRQAFHGRLRI